MVAKTTPKTCIDFSTDQHPIIQLNRYNSKMSLLKGGKQLRSTFGSYHGRSKEQLKEKLKK
jgi:hypothetical protein